jgi:hypothetical protein
VQDVNFNLVSDVRGLEVGAELRISFANGWVRTEVKELGA